MSLNISTNTAALKAGINLAYNTKQLHASMNRLSSGKKTEFPCLGSWKPRCFHEITVLH